MLNRYWSEASLLSTGGAELCVGLVLNQIIILKISNGRKVNYKLLSTVEFNLIFYDLSLLQLSFVFLKL